MDIIHKGMQLREELLINKIKVYDIVTYLKIYLHPSIYLEGCNFFAPLKYVFK